MPKHIPSIIIAGKIGVGKTTITEKLKKEIEKRLALVLKPENNNIKISLLFEPVGEWKYLELLSSFYKDMKRYAYSFQQYVFASRLASILDILDKENPDLIISDSHVIFDRHCFAEMLNESGFISDIEMKWYLKTYDNWRKLVPSVGDPTIIVYLKVDNSNVIINRIKNRDRKEEVGITCEYLDKLQMKIESLLESQTYCKNVITIDATTANADEIVKEIYEKLDLREIIPLSSTAATTVMKSERMGSIDEMIIIMILISSFIACTFWVLDKWKF